MVFENNNEWRTTLIDEVPRFQWKEAAAVEYRGRGRARPTAFERSEKITLRRDMLIDLQQQKAKVQLNDEKLALEGPKLGVEKMCSVTV